MKYTVRGPIEGRLDDYYVMENGEECTFFDFQGQAEICAWAFNQIAQCRIITALVAPDVAPTGSPRYAGFYCEDYKGSTDGVV